jgi:radical SAM superfamily enzyme YgiQ (UPF0313 family)
LTKLGDETMKLTLIKPKMGHSEDGSYREKAVMEPLALAVIAALTPPDVEVVMYDDRIEPIPYDDPTDLVAITAETFTAKRAYQISREYKKRGVSVILGGYHPSQMPEEAKRYADSVYIGDAEALWPQVVQDAVRGRLQPFYEASFGAPLPNLYPRRDIFDGKPYVPITLTQFSRGCPFHCNFCTISSFYNRRSFFRPVRDVITEIENQERKLLLFVDDNIVMERKAAKELFRALIPLKIRWLSQASITMTQDLELMELMAKSGCIGHLVGFESINRKSLEAMGKKHNLKKFDVYHSQLQVVRDFGLLIWAAFTLGHEFDTAETIRQTLELSLKYKFPLADFNVLLPYPNTPLYHQLEREGRLLFDGKWWLHPEYRFGDAAFRPHGMAPEELAEACLEARKKFYTIRSVFRRAVDFKTNMRSLYRFRTYAIGNLLHFHDTLRKQEILLGDGAELDGNTG